MITAKLKGKDFRFETKPGLFSKDEIDTGSKLLIEHVHVGLEDQILDLGCGYGAIGLVLATEASTGKVYMVDTDIRAVKYSQVNANINHINNVEILASDGFEKLPKILFNVIVSNPPSHVPKETIIEFIKGAKYQLLPEGKLYFVNERRLKPMIKREFEQIFGNYEVVAENSQYILSVAHQD